MKSGRKSLSTLKSLEDLALESGATRAKAIPVASIALDERASLKCQVPLCPHYNRCLTCPPNIIGPDKFSRILKKYKRAILLQVKEKMDGFAFSDPRGREQIDLAALKLHEAVNIVESKAFSLGYLFACGFIGGHCRLCKECVNAKLGESCRHPYKARPSMEGVGIDVRKTAAGAGFDIDFNDKGKVSWTGLVLLD